MRATVCGWKILTRNLMKMMMKTQHMILYIWKRDSIYQQYKLYSVSNYHMHSILPSLNDISSIISFLANFSFFVIIRMITNHVNMRDATIKSKNYTKDLFQGFMLASIAKFFFLPIIIWRENMSGISSSVHLVLVIAYFLISLIYIHSSVIGCPKKWSAVTIITSFFVNKYLWFNIYFNRRF